MTRISIHICITMGVFWWFCSALYYSLRWVTRSPLCGWRQSTWCMAGGSWCFKGSTWTFSRNALFLTDCGMDVWVVGGDLLGRHRRRYLQRERERVTKKKMMALMSTRLIKIKFKWTCRKNYTRMHSYRSCLWEPERRLPEYNEPKKKRAVALYKRRKWN